MVWRIHTAFEWTETIIFILSAENWTVTSKYSRWPPYQYTLTDYWWVRNIILSAVKIIIRSDSTTEQRKTLIQSDSTTKKIVCEDTLNAYTIPYAFGSSCTQIQAHHSHNTLASIASLQYVYI